MYVLKNGFWMLEKTKLVLKQGHRNGIIKSYAVDKVPHGIFATAYYEDGEVNMASIAKKFVVYEFVGGKTAIYGEYDTHGKAASAMLKGTFKRRKAKKVI